MGKENMKIILYCHLIAQVLNKLGEKVGEGFFSAVYVAELERWNAHGKKEKMRVAVKNSIKSKCCEKGLQYCEAIHDDLKEASFLALCKHEFVVELIGITMVDKHHVAIVMPCYNYSLRDYVKDTNNIITIIF